MSLVFVGPCAVFHHQYFKMVDMLIHHCEMNAEKLNACVKTHVLKHEVEEVIATKQKDKREMELMKGDDLEWISAVKENQLEESTCRCKTCMGLKQ